MSSLHIFEHRTIYPLAKLGLAKEYWGINIDTLQDTWVAMFFIVLITYGIRLVAGKYQHKLTAFSLRLVCKAFKSTIEETLGTFDQDVFNFIFGLFLFTLFCNYIGIIPHCGEPTTDINTALAIGISSFAYVQYQGIKHKGWRYFNKFFAPIFILFPLNIIQQSAKIASLSFRLFGNMLGDTIIWGLLFSLIQTLWFIYIPLVCSALLFLYLSQKYSWLKNHKWSAPLRLLATGIVSFVSCLEIFFTLFGGLVQAYVIALLTTMYIASERTEGGH